MKPNLDQQIKDTIDYKSKKIGKAIDAKEKSMAIMASGRDATLIMAEIIRADAAKGIPMDERDIPEIRKRIAEWRNWFYYNIYTLDPDEALLQEAKEKGEVNPF